MFDRFSEPTCRAIDLAEDEARKLKHEYTDTGHLLLGLLAQRESIAARTLEQLGISIEGARAQLVRILGVGEESAVDQKGLSPRASLVLELALGEADLLGAEEVAPHHILLALWRENTGVGASILLRLDADDEQIPEEITRVLSGEKRRERAEHRWTPAEGISPSQRSGGVRRWEELQRDRQRVRALLRRELREGSRDLAEVIRDPPPQVLSAKVSDLLLMAGGRPALVRRVRAMADARISPTRRLDELSPRQRRRLIEHLSDPPPQTPSGNS